MKWVKILKIMFYEFEAPEGHYLKLKEEMVEKMIIYSKNSTTVIEDQIQTPLLDQEYTRTDKERDEIAEKTVFRMILNWRWG